MRAFDYRAPGSIKEAVGLLAAAGARARPLAGGTDLIVQLRRGTLAAEFLVDLKRIPEVTALSFDPEQGLIVGAALPLYRIYETAEVAARYPALAEAAGIIGGPAIRGRATLGGNLCNAAPSADSIPALIVLYATCLVAGPEGARTLPVERFCTGPGQTVLAPGEILVSIHLPPPRPHSGAAYLRFTPRGEMDLAVAGVGASLALGEDGAVTAARLALGAVGPTPILAEEAAVALVGRPLNGDSITEAAGLAERAARPIDDVRGSAAQRRHLVGVLARRALALAQARAEGKEPHGGES